MIVIDASALAKYLLRERGWERVEEFLEQGVYSVPLALKEVLNAVWKRAAIHRVLDAGAATTLYQALRILVDEGVVVLEPQEEYLGEALRIALETRLTIYDALYVAQARRHSGLLTADERQAAVAERLGVKVHRV